MSPEWFVCLVPVALSLFLWRKCSRKLAARVLCVSLPLVIFLIVGYRYGALSEAETEKQFQIEQVVYATLQSGGSA